MQETRGEKTGREDGGETHACDVEKPVQGCLGHPNGRRCVRSTDGGEQLSVLEVHSIDGGVFGGVEAVEALLAHCERHVPDRLAKEIGAEGSAQPWLLRRCDLEEVDDVPDSIGNGGL